MGVGYFFFAEMEVYMGGLRVPGSSIVKVSLVVVVDIAI